MIRRLGRPRGSALLVLALLLIGSAVLRFSLEAAPAIAREVSSVSDREETQPSADLIEADDLREEYRQMLTLFQERELRLEQREAEMNDRMQAVTIAETAIDRKLAELTEAEERLRATLAMADGAAEGDLARLTGFYERMKPKDSAALFEEMDPQFAAGFLARMQPEAAAGILANLSPNVAYSISVVLAGRNARAPRE